MFNCQKSKTTSTTFSPLSSLTKLSQTHPPHHQYLFSLFSSASQTQPPPSSSLNSLYLTLTNTLNIHSLLQRPTRRSSKPYPPLTRLHRSRSSSPPYHHHQPWRHHLPPFHLRRLCLRFRSNTFFLLKSEPLLFSLLSHFRTYSLH